MSNGNASINIFEKILQRFSFKQILPREVKVFILRYERNALIKTLQNFGDYNFIYGLAVRIFFLSYKLKLSFSIKQSKIALGLISSMTAGMLAGAVLYNLDFLKINKFASSNIQLPAASTLVRDVIPVEKTINAENTELKKTGIKDAEGNKNIKYRLGVNPFVANNIRNELSKQVTDNISGKLSRILGKGSVIDLSKNWQGISFNRILSGSVSGLGNKIIISIKIIDVKDSKLIFGVAETMESADEIGKKCEEIAEIIAEKIDGE
ncbi:MAG: hypothetical protein JXN64_07820 [Spirochaetes bacterium]|nr:hypothetical protein [Spirochaetota bacterium]